MSFMLEWVTDFQTPQICHLCIYCRISSVSNSVWGDWYFNWHCIIDHNKEVKWKDARKWFSLQDFHVKYHNPHCNKEVSSFQVNSDVRTSVHGRKKLNEKKIIAWSVQWQGPTAAYLYHKVLISPLLAIQGI